MTLENYKILKKIDEGDYSTFYCAIDIVKKRMVGIKKLKINLINEKNEMYFLHELIASLLLPDHPNISRFLDIIIDNDEDKIYYVSKFIPGITLKSYLNSNTYLKLTGFERKKFAILICYKLLKHLDFINSYSPIKNIFDVCFWLNDEQNKNIFKSFFHGDIHLRNIMIKSYTNEPAIIDFGQSYLFSVRNRIYPETPPELLNIDTYRGEKCDIYSLGVILFKLLYKEEYPFKLHINDLTVSKNKMKYLESIKKKLYSKELCDNSIDNLIKQMLLFNPEKRPSIKECILELEKNLNRDDIVLDFRSDNIIEHEHTSNFFKIIENIMLSIDKIKLSKRSIARLGNFACLSFKEVKSKNNNKNIDKIFNNIINIIKNHIPDEILSVSNYLKFYLNNNHKSNVVDEIEKNIFTLLSLPLEKFKKKFHERYNKINIINYQKSGILYIVLKYFSKKILDEMLLCNRNKHIESIYNNMLDYSKFCLKYESLVDIEEYNRNISIYLLQYSNNLYFSLWNLIILFTMYKLLMNDNEDFSDKTGIHFRNNIYLISLNISKIIKLNYKKKEIFILLHKFINNYYNDLFQIKDPVFFFKILNGNNLLCYLAILSEPMYLNSINSEINKCLKNIEQIIIQFNKYISINNHILDINIPFLIENLYLYLQNYIKRVKNPFSNNLVRILFRKLSKFFNLLVFNQDNKYDFVAPDDKKNIDKVIKTIYAEKNKAIINNNYSLYLKKELIFNFILQNNVSVNDDFEKLVSSIIYFTESLLSFEPILKKQNIYNKIKTNYEKKIHYLLSK